MPEITVRKGSEVRTVVPDNTENTYQNNCFTAKAPPGGGRENYHIRDVCGITPTIVKDDDLWDIIQVGEILGWPPQENDVWKSPDYVMHFINGKFHFKNMYSDDVYSEWDADDAKNAASDNLILLYRHDGNTV